MPLAALIGPAFDGISKLISQFHMAPEEKAQLQAAHDQLQANLIQQAQDYEIELNKTAAGNIQADANSKDPYTERSRPTFLYIVEAILATNYLVIPICAVFGAKVQPFPLPADLLTLFGVCVCGYVTARSADKALALPGSSSISILGMKASNDDGSQNQTPVSTASKT